MSSRVQLLSVQPLNTPSPINTPVSLKITFEVYEDLADPVDWEMLFAWDGDEEHDLILETVEVGPIKAGKHQFIFEADPPDYTKVHDEDLTDVSVLFLRCKYHDQLFSKVAFFVSHTYVDEELINEPPLKPILEKLERKIHLEDLRVTHYPIKWNEQDELVPPPEDENVDMMEEDVAIFTARRPEPEITSVIPQQAQSESIQQPEVPEEAPKEPTDGSQHKGALSDKTNE
ncbi:unnamed protein product [Bursaphelenchus xylophilus]|uniref:(pine wood nematode) hypothetical protein n=1 Tax=Bursaphelenchus xylophilus TaxID=6326 RepID=A0A1I7RW66_BURXY|nr:unnamed protein product [Bursaphelenchus xylophilus]CAG9095197.1 unnamed protein product [Bursaphelenchus xylophilus]